MIFTEVATPSATIREGYETTVVITDDGRTLSGFVVGEDPGGAVGERAHAEDEGLEGLPTWSRVATVAVLVVVFTGVVRGLRELGGISGIFDTAYGVLLAVKVGLVLVTLLVATVARDAVHRRWALDPEEVGKLRAAGRMNRYEAAWHLDRHYASMPAESASRVTLIKRAASSLMLPTATVRAASPCSCLHRCRSSSTSSCRFSTAPAPTRRRCLKRCALRSSGS